MLRGLGLLVLCTIPWMLTGCAKPIEGAWETKVTHPQGSDPTGYELHLTLSKFMTGEPGGAAEYKVFREAGRIETCKSTLEAVSKGDGVYEYVESLTQGPCGDGMTIRVRPQPPDKLQWERIDADGNVEMSATLDVQTGIETAKGLPGA